MLVFAREVTFYYDGKFLTIAMYFIYMYIITYNHLCICLFI